MLKKLLVLLSFVATAYGQPVTAERQYLKLLMSTATGGAGDTVDYFESGNECDVANDNCGTGYVCVHSHCNDVDECAAGSDNCGTSDTCSNTEGGFTCVVRRRLKDNTLRNCLMFIIFNVIGLAALIWCCQPSNSPLQEQESLVPPADTLVPPTDRTKSPMESQVQSLHF